MIVSTSTGDGFPIRCNICGKDSIVSVSKPPGDSVCPVCGSLLWVTALVEITRRISFVPDLQIASLDATTRDDALRKISIATSSELGWNVEQQESLSAALLKREELGSTAIGQGLAIPHAKLDWISDGFTVMALVPDGIDFHALDGKPVHTVVMIASPQDCADDHLRLLERVSSCLRLAGSPGS